MIEAVAMMAEPAHGGPGKMQARLIGDVAIAALAEADALALIHAHMDAASHLKLAFANAHLVNEAARNPALADILAGFLILPDGVGVDLGTRLLYGAPFPANLNGTDFIPKLIMAAPRPLTIALVGAKPGVAQKAAAALSRLAPLHAIEALSDGYFDAAGQERILSRLAERPVDLLLIALGNPRQEMWIAGNLEARHARVVAGVGALFDFLAGEVPRAPPFIRTLRCEWLYRLAIEPGRLWRRYVLGNPLFLLGILRQKLAGRP